MPLKRMRSGHWLCRTSKVSPSTTRTTSPRYSETRQQERVSGELGAQRRAIVASSFPLWEDAFPFMHGRPPIGACQPLQYSNENGGPIAGTAVCFDAM